MSSELAIDALNLSKYYTRYEHPFDRLKQLFFPSHSAKLKQFCALRDVSLQIVRGEVIGIVGRNGAGKSTLLQMVCGTIAPSSGSLAVHGRIAALLELGAGFNPEFTGRENVYLNASILGLSKEETDARFDEIVDFSGVRDFIDQPVKTYSSGMYVRLAFSVAISVNPEILVVDEALSVGDGAFSRKSFERIMALKDAGTTILFCSHALYQVEALCSRAIWLEAGSIRAIGPAADVVASYAESLQLDDPVVPVGVPAPSAVGSSQLNARVVRVGLHASGGDNAERLVTLTSGCESLTVTVDFMVDPELPMPSVGVLFADRAGRNIASAGSHIDGVSIPRSQGGGRVAVSFPDFSLLKGDYVVQVFLLCERGIHCYEHVMDAGVVRVRQNHLEQGVVSLPHVWNIE